MQEPVVFNATWRRLVGQALCTARESRQIEMLAMAVGDQHVHLQIQMPFGRARYEAGILKNHAGHTIKQQGWSGNTWAKRSKAVPIRTRDHQLKVFRYILKHEHEGAWVWDWKRGAHEKP